MTFRQVNNNSVGSAGVSGIAKPDAKPKKKICILL